MGRERVLLERKTVRAQLGKRPYKAVPEYYKGYEEKGGIFHWALALWRMLQEEDPAMVPAIQGC